MDYVLFGMGYGATLMLLGWALRTFGPQLKYSRPAQPEESNFPVEQRCWVRFIQGLGGVMAIVGSAMVLLTFVVVLVNPDDSTGTTIALAIWIFGIITMLLWCVLYVRQFGLTGIWSPTGGYRNPSAASLSTTTSAGSALSNVRPKKRVERETAVEPVVANESESDAESEVVSESVETEETDPHPESEPEFADVDSNDVEEAHPATDAIYDFGDSADTTVTRDAGSRAEALRRLRERQARARQTST